MRTLKDYFQQGLESLTIMLPDLEEKLEGNKHTCVFGEGLAGHLRLNMKTKLDKVS